MTPPAKTAAVLVGHGSRQKGFAAPMIKVARALRGGEFGQVICAYLTVSAPSIEQAVGRLAARGFRDIRVLPYFVLSGKHVTTDVPGIVRVLSRKYRGQAKVRLCPYLGYDPGIVSVVRKRLRAAAW